MRAPRMAFDFTSFPAAWRGRQCSTRPTAGNRPKRSERRPASGALGNSGDRQSCPPSCLNENEGRGGVFSACGLDRPTGSRKIRRISLRPVGGLCNTEPAPIRCHGLLAALRNSATSLAHRYSGSFLGSQSHAIMPTISVSRPPMPTAICRPVRNASFACTTAAGAMPM